MFFLGALKWLYGPDEQRHESVRVESPLVLAFPAFWIILAIFGIFLAFGRFDRMLRERGMRKPSSEPHPLQPVAVALGRLARRAGFEVYMLVRTEIKPAVRRLRTYLAPAGVNADR